VWNWLALTNDEHEALHGLGDEHFLAAYPHLTGKFERAKKQAALLLHPRKTEGESLATEALA